MRSMPIVCVALLSYPLTASAESEKTGLPEQARVILEKAASFELSSNDPAAEVESKDKSVRSYGKILGKTTIKNEKEGKEALEALFKAVGKGNGAKCFEPRHIIHAEYEGKSVNLVICFECSWVYVYLDGKNERAARLTIDKKVEPLFDKLLRDAKVPLPEKK
jgi:hypothetical protein